MEKSNLRNQLLQMNVKGFIQDDQHLAISDCKLPDDACNKLTHSFTCACAYV